uniref:Uncharacterized protein n=1 Tax=Solanum tuberosum TaxID=4113 RepID=M1BT34_SOLTU
MRAISCNLVYSSYRKKGKLLAKVESVHNPLARSLKTSYGACSLGLEVASRDYPI